MVNLHSKQRNSIIDIGKGIAIILMSIGHSYCPERLDVFIPLFHMAFFFHDEWLLLFLKKSRISKRFYLEKNYGTLFPICEMGYRVCFFT